MSEYLTSGSRPFCSAERETAAPGRGRSRRGGNRPSSSCSRAARGLRLATAAGSRSCRLCRRRKLMRMRTSSSTIRRSIATRRKRECRIAAAGVGFRRVGRWVLIDSPADVLVVDDDPEVIEVVRMMLCCSGYEVRCARNGKEAIDAVAQRIPAVRPARHVHAGDGRLGVRAGTADPLWAHRADRRRDRGRARSSAR